MKTSPEMIKAIENEMDLSSFVKILEPSAGTGDLAAHFAAAGNCIVTVCELNVDNAMSLARSKLYKLVHRGDFLKFVEQDLIYKEYDYVVAVPPYKDNMDCQHIMAMYKCCRKNGLIISFTLPHWVTGIHTNQREFRQWLSGKNYRMKIFENDESYVGCPKMLLIIQK